MQNYTADLGIILGTTTLPPFPPQFACRSGAPLCLRRGAEYRLAHLESPPAALLIRQSAYPLPKERRQRTIPATSLSTTPAGTATPSTANDRSNPSTVSWAPCSPKTKESTPAAPSLPTMQVQETPGPPATPRWDWPTAPSCENTRKQEGK